MDRHLENIFQQMHGLLRGEQDAASVAEQLGLPQERLAAYQRFVAGHVKDLLRKHFTVLAASWPDSLWQEVAGRFFAAQPPDHFELNQAARPFPEFLAQLASKGELGVQLAHAELAELEWQEFAVHTAPAAMPDPKQLSQPQLNPTLVVLQLSYPLSSFLGSWRRWQAADNEGREPQLPTSTQPEVVFVCRHPHTQSHQFHRASDALLLAFKLVHDQLPATAAAQEAGISVEDVERSLELAEHAGIVILPR